MSVENLNSSDYRFLKEMLDEEVGILLEEGKEYLAVTRLETVMPDFDIPNLTMLVSRLRKNDRALKASVIDAMTVNETLFFRDPNVWRSLREKLLPDLIESKSDTMTLRCWSAASSSGQEPYSLAIVISELLGKEDASWDVSVTATDLSREMVARTKAGVYSNYEVSRGMKASTRDRYFNQRGEKWQVNDRLKSRVEARPANLSRLPSDLGPFDIILLRNVLIYFSAETRAAVLRKMATMLTPNGCLLLGASEGAVGVPSELVPHRMSGLVAFRRPETDQSDSDHLVSAKLRSAGPDEEAKSSGIRATPTQGTKRRSRASRLGVGRRRRSEDPMPTQKDTPAKPESTRSRRSHDATPARQPAAKRSSQRVDAGATGERGAAARAKPGEPSALERLQALRAERERRGR